jgi:CPA2 family monovalent cation:H+ antiporter-2
MPHAEPWSVLTLAASAGGAQQMVALFIILTVAGITALVMGRAGIAAIPAFLIAGAIAGPHAIGLVGSTDELGTISDLAIIMLMFGIGMHIDPAELKGGSIRLVLAGLLAVVSATLAIWPVTMAFGLDWAGGLALAMALSVSSTAVVLRRLMQRRELKKPTGQLSLAILIVQDLAVPIMLIAIGALGRLRAGGDGGEDTNALVVVGLALGSVAGAAGLVVLGRWLLPRLLRQASIVGSDEVMLALGVSIAIGSALFTAWIGFSYELGAFLSGLVLGGTPFRHQVSALMGPARDLFLAVFFTTLGMAVDPAPLADLWFYVLIAGTAMVVIKSLTIGLSSWAVWGTPVVAGSVGLMLSQAGEFSLILMKEASASGLIDETTSTAGVSIVVVSLILTPLPIWIGKHLKPILERAPLPPWRDPRHAVLAHEPEDDGAVRVVIGGFGPIGRVAADQLERAGIKTTLIELNEKTVRTHAAMGRRIVYGDLSKAEVLESAGVREADALILTTPDEQANLKACGYARSVNPEMCIVVRTSHLGSGLRAKTMGADAIVVEEVAAAEAMEKIVAERFHVDLPRPSD